MKEKVELIVDVDKENSNLYKSIVRRASRLDRKGLELIDVFLTNYKG